MGNAAIFFQIYILLKNIAAPMIKAILYTTFLLLSIILLSCSSEEETSFVSRENRISEKVYSDLWEAFYENLDSHNLDGAMTFADSIKSLASIEHNKKWIAKASKAIGYVYSEKGLIKESTTSYLIAAKLFKQSGHLKDLADIYINLGTHYYENLDYATAISFYKKGGDIYHYEGNNTDKALALRSLAMCRNKLQDFAGAEKLVELARNTAKNTKDYHTLGLISNTSGIILADQKKYPEARAFYLQTIQYADSLGGHKYLEGLSKTNIGEAFFLEGKDKEAKTWLKDAIEAKIDAGNYIFAQFSYNLLAKILIKEQEYEEAIYLLESSLDAIEPGAIDQSIDEGLTLMNQALMAINKDSNPAHFAFLNKKLASYNQRLITYSQNVSETREKLDTESRQNNLKEAIEQHVLNEQIAKYEERNTYMQYAFLIPVFFLICAMVSVYLSIRRNKEYKKLYSKIEDTISASKGLRHLKKK